MVNQGSKTKRSKTPAGMPELRLRGIVWGPYDAIPPPEAGARLGATICHALHSCSTRTSVTMTEEGKNTFIRRKVILTANVKDPVLVQAISAIRAIDVVVKSAPALTFSEYVRRQYHRNSFHDDAGISGIFVHHGQGDLLERKRQSKPSPKIPFS